MPNAASRRRTQTIPDSELWLHQPEASARLDGAMAAMGQPPLAADLEALEQHLGRDPAEGQ
jgi:hypothetical protein